MPIVHKVPASIAAAWSARPVAHPRIKDDRYTWTARPATLYTSGRSQPLTVAPRVGDVLRLRAPAQTPPEQVTGVVLGVRVRKDGIWTHVNLAHNSTVKWVAKQTIGAHLGRTKGITRVDQPTKVLKDRVHGGTHGWFVRIYDGKQPRIARTFSDGAAGGILESLKAALAFHAAHAGLSADEGIPFFRS
jgi:hypothetical protein